LTLQQLKDALAKIAGLKFQVKEVPVTLYYASVMELLKELKSIGASYKGTREDAATKGLFASLEACYKEQFKSDSGIPASWHILYVVGEKQ
jgi:hypothetical protein